MDDQIKPVAWKCVWFAEREGCDWEQYHDERDPMPERWDDAPDEITPLYSQQAIDSLRAEVEKWKSAVIFGQDGLVAHLDRTEEDIRRLVLAANKWSERELLFGAHEDLQARAERAEARIDKLELALMVAASDLQSYGHHAAAHRAACAARAPKQGAE